MIFDRRDICFSRKEMAYGKKKGYKRPYRKSKKLSNYNIATKTSARAQSKQIYALKKRVNQIYRLTRPETQIQVRQAQSISQTASAINVAQFLTTSSNYDKSIVPSVFLASTTDAMTGSAPVNNWVRSHSFSLYGNWQYSTVDPANSPLTLRLVIVQQKKTRGDAITADDIFQSTSAFTRTFGPLQDGITATVRVLSDKRYNLNFQRPNINIKTNLRYLYNFRRDTSSGSGSGSSSDNSVAGTIYVFYAIYGPLATLPTNTLNLGYKLAWSDS